ncbi:MAG TPA: DNA repair protein RadC [Myxococcaceae bacterium]|nr:DNA repair protein RadC [Myxococcaceae bacterium]
MGAASEGVGGEGRGPSEAQEPRDRLLALGASALSDQELLSLVLGARGEMEPALEKARWLLEISGGLRALLLRDPTELADEHGLDFPRAALLSAAAELGRRVQRGSDPRPILETTRDISRWVGSMASFSREVFRVLALDARRRLLRDILASSGCVDRCMVDPREALAPAVVARATFVVLIHNHPSGNPEPSSMDFDITQRLVDGAAVLGMRVLDHLVVASEGYTSMLAMRCLPQPRLLTGAELASGWPRPRLTPDLESG